MAFRILPGSVERRFWAKVEKTENCWLWKGALTHFGHGQVRIQGRLLRSHRVSWEWSKGPVLDGLCVLHKCDVPNCVNPDHLFLGTKADNTQDMMAKGRNKFIAHTGEANGPSKLTLAQVEEIRSLYSKGGSPQGKGRYIRGCITQSQLAKQYGVSQVTIGNIIRGDRWSSKP